MQAARSERRDLATFVPGNNPNATRHLFAAGDETNDITIPNNQT